MTTVAKRELRPTHPGSLTVSYCTPLPIHLPPRISFNPTSTSGCSGNTVITDARTHGLVVVALVCIVSDIVLGDKEGLRSSPLNLVHSFDSSLSFAPT